MGCIPKPAIESCGTGQRIPVFDSWQLTITWMSNTKLNTDIRDLKSEVFRHFLRTANVKKSRDQGLAVRFTV